MAELIESIERDHGALHGIIHSAGIKNDNFILKKTSTEFRQVLAPKLAGTRNLDDLTLLNGTIARGAIDVEIEAPIEHDLARTRADSAPVDKTTLISRRAIQ